MLLTMAPQGRCARSCAPPTYKHSTARPRADRQLCSTSFRCRAASTEAPAQQADSPSVSRSMRSADQPSAFPSKDIGNPVTEEELQRYLRLYRSTPQERSYIIPESDVQVPIRG